MVLIVRLSEQDKKDQKKEMKRGRSEGAEGEDFGQKLSWESEELLGRLDVGFKEAGVARESILTVFRFVVPSLAPSLRRWVTKLRKGQRLFVATKASGKKRALTDEFCT